MESFFFGLIISGVILLVPEILDYFLGLKYGIKSKKLGQHIIYNLQPKRKSCNITKCETLISESTCEKSHQLRHFYKDFKQLLLLGQNFFEVKSHFWFMLL